MVVVSHLFLFLRKSFRGRFDSCESNLPLFGTIYFPTAPDSRYLHRGAFLWELADKRKDLSTVQGQLFQMLNRLEQIRRQENVFSQEAEVYTYDVHNDSILGILREYKGERFIALFNFSENEQTAWMQEEGIFRNLVNGEIVEVKDPVLKGYEFVWMKYKA